LFKAVRQIRQREKQMSFENLPGRKFGVEIEFVGLNPQTVAELLTNAGIPCQHEGYNHTTRNRWKVVRDGSIEYRSDDCGELVSPPLVGREGIDQVRKVLRLIAAGGATVNRSCGLHVHVDANDLSVSQIHNIVARYSTFQAEINRFMPASRRNSRWAKPVDSYLLSYISNYSNRSGGERLLRSNSVNYDRYYAVNIAAYGRHGTVEFRQHSASVNSGKVARWIAFCLFFVNASIENQPVLSVPTTAVAQRPGTARRGRGANYAARRALVELLQNPPGTGFARGATLRQLSEASGYASTTLASSIFGQLRGMGRLRGRGAFDRYSFTVTNAPALQAWLGYSTTGADISSATADSTASQTVTAVAPVPATPSPRAAALLARREQTVQDLETYRIRLGNVGTVLSTMDCECGSCVALLRSNITTLNRRLDEIDRDLAVIPAAAPQAIPVPSVPDTLFRSMPSELQSYYQERAMDLDPR